LRPQALEETRLQKVCQPEQQDVVPNAPEIQFAQVCQEEQPPGGRPQDLLEACWQSQEPPVAVPRYSRPAAVEERFCVGQVPLVGRSEPVY
jgi:hypothetical protein